MKQFDWEKFKKEKIAVHCKTEDEADDFCHRLSEIGCCWASGNSYSNNTKWGYYKECTCYSGDGYFSDVDYYKRHDYEIIKWSDYMEDNSFEEKVDETVKELLKPIEKESINHPSHYNMGGMECIDEMIMIFGKKWTMIFCIMNAWKYRKRAPYKGTLEQDMEKSNWYLKEAKKLKKSRKKKRK